MSECNRTHVEVKVYQNSYSGEMEEEWITVPDCNFIDTSLHSYMCTTCGEKKYYSTRGRISEQLGVPLDDINFDGTLRTKTPK